MTSRRLLPLAAALLVLGGCRGTSSRRPPIHLNPNMDNQVRDNPQSESGFFPDGRSNRLPPDGTVAAGSFTTDEHLTKGLVDGKPAETLPDSLHLDAAFLARGQQRFEIYCTPCHDYTGSGKGTVISRGMLPPPSFHDDRLRAQPIGYFFQVVSNGVRNMPAYGPQVPVQDRWAIACYVRALQRSRSATLDQVPADVAAAKGWKP